MNLPICVCENVFLCICEDGYLHMCTGYVSVKVTCPCVYEYVLCMLVFMYVSVCVWVCDFMSIHLCVSTVRVYSGTLY